jgi:uncharacterized protein (DUF488 family)
VRAIYTFGYQGFTVDELAAKATELGAIVIDTRMSAWSKSPEWQMKALAERLGWDGYRFFGKTFGNVNYKSQTAPIQLANVDEGLRLIAPFLEKQPIVLLCGCWSFATCHRTVVAKAISERFGSEVIHLTRSNMPRVKAEPKEEVSENLDLPF